MTNSKYLLELSMGLSLQEQLLKAGMVNKKQMKQAEHEKRVQKNQKGQVSV